MASHKIMMLTAQSLSTRSDYSFTSTIQTVNEYFDLGPQEYKAFTYIAGLAELCQGVCFPSQSKIAEKLDVDRTRANKIVAQLVKKGLLVVAKIEGIRNNFYLIPTIAELIQKVSNKIQEVTAKIKEGMKKTAEKARQAYKKVVHATVSKRARIVKSDANYLPDWFEQYQKENAAEEEIKQLSQEELVEQRKYLEKVLAKYKK